MAFGSAAAEYDVAFRANTGQFRADMSVIGREYARTTAGMSDQALRAAVVQEKLDVAIRRHGPTSRQAKEATLAYRRELAALGTTSVHTSRDLNHAEHELSRFARGALTGTGVLHGLGRAAAFASTTFLGGAGLVYGLRKVVEAGQEQGRILANLRNAVTDAGYSWSGYRQQIEAATEASKKASAFDDDELYKSLQTLIRATGDVNKALVLNAKVTDIARGSGKPLQAIAAAVAKAYDGQTAALRRLVPTIAAGVKGQQAIADAARTYSGAATTYTKTAVGAQTSLTVAIGDTEKAIGRQLLPTVKEYEVKLADWLDKTSNQKRIQRDVNEALKEAKDVVHGLADAEHLLAPPIHAFISALGGLEHATETAFVVYLAAKARKAADAIGLIKLASNKARTAIVADALIEERALAGVAGSAAIAGGGVAGAGAGGALARVGVGGAIGGILARGGKLLTKGGEIYLVYKGLQFALSSSPPTSQTGPNRYQGSNLGQDYKNFGSDAIHHPINLLENVGKGLLNDTGFTHYGSSGISAVVNGPKYSFTDLLPAVQAGELNAKGLQWLRDHGRIPDLGTYNGLVALARQNRLDHITIDTRFRSGAPGTATLTPAQKRAQDLALHPNDRGALTAQLVYDQHALAFLQKRFAAGKISGPAYLAQLQTLTGDRDQQQSGIDQLDQAAAAKRRAAAAHERAVAAKAKAAAAKLQRDRARQLREAIAVQAQPLQDAAAQALAGDRAHSLARLTVLPGSNPGLIAAGNIDINHRKVAHNPDGSISTVRTISIQTDQGEVLIPTVVNGRVVSDKEAIAHYMKTRQQLGVFSSIAAANKYSVRLHDQQAQLYASGTGIGGLPSEPPEVKKLIKFYKRKANNPRLTGKEQARYAHLANQEQAKWHSLLLILGHERTAALVKARKAQAAELVKQRAIRDAILQNQLAEAQLAETKAGSNTAAVAAARAREAKVLRAILKPELGDEKGLTGLALQRKIAETIATRSAIAQLTQKTAATPSAGVDFFTEAASEFGLYGSNIGPAGTILSGQDARGAAGGSALLHEVQRLTAEVHALRSEAHHRGRAEITHAKTTAHATKAIAAARPAPIDDARLAAHYGY